MKLKIIITILVFFVNLSITYSYTEIDSTITENDVKIDLTQVKKIVYKLINKEVSLDSLQIESIIHLTKPNRVQEQIKIRNKYEIVNGILDDILPNDTIIVKYFNGKLLIDKKETPSNVDFLNSITVKIEHHKNNKRKICYLTFIEYFHKYYFEGARHYKDQTYHGEIIKYE